MKFDRPIHYACNIGTIKLSAISFIFLNRVKHDKSMGQWNVLMTEKSALGKSPHDETFFFHDFCIFFFLEFPVIDVVFL